MSSNPTIVALDAADQNDLSLVEILDHVLNSGIVLQGSIVISLAGVDLIYIGLSAVITSVETALSGSHPQPGRKHLEE
ncbi:MAG TPA: gas vesicle protein [Terriglobales bacterium]|nr:gas vesicle protein [Terriglobales bacterium]